eukprot:13295333-Ditylum_brightwellii.AAC.1
MHIVDDECSTALKEHIRKNKCNFQIVPPHIHCRNSAEKVIQTFKDHLLSGLNKHQTSEGHAKLIPIYWQRSSSMGH